MNTTHKRKTTRKRPIARGTAAVCGAAVLLGGMVLFMTRPDRAALSAPPDSSETALPGETGVPLTPNPYGPGDFYYDGDYLACSAGPSVLGVDVSAHQQEIDWAQVAGAGVEFSMVRVGFRGTTEGNAYLDEYAGRNLRGAREAGLQVGAYFFSQAISPEEAAEEAALCIEFLRDYELDLPVVFDWEYTGDDTRTAGIAPETLLACARTFCEAVEDAGYEAMIYFNPHIAETVLDLSRLQDYPFWLAMYTDQMTYPYAVEMWQYTANGKVPGIAGDADLNLWLGG